MTKELKEKCISILYKHYCSYKCYKGVANELGDLANSKWNDFASDEMKELCNKLDVMKEIFDLSYHEGEELFNECQKRYIREKEDEE